MTRQLHPDILTDAPDTDYFVLGDGRLMAILQWSRHPGMTPLGIVLCDPERMSRKEGSLLFHPEHGLARTMLALRSGDQVYRPTAEGTTVAWEENGGRRVRAHWHAGEWEVLELFSIQRGSSNLVRDVYLRGPRERAVSIEGALYANPLYFDDFTDRDGGALHAAGYTALALHAAPAARSMERFVTVDVPAGRDPAIPAATFIYAIEAVGTHEFSLWPTGAPAVDIEREERHELFPGLTDDAAPTLAERVERTYRIARRSLRGGVSQLGRFDASIWQYDFEWGMDSAMVAIGAATAGLFDLARQTLGNVLRRLSNAEGMIAEASRFRGGEMAELNANGAVLDALWHYWRRSGDETLLRAYWNRVRAIADYPLRPEFQHASGLLRSRRDFWERTPWMGVGEGFELAHQLFCALGLERAAEIATAFGHRNDAERWSAASGRIRSAMLSDPHFSLVEEGRFIRRRLIDGSVERRLGSARDWRAGEWAPYVGAPPAEGASCEPDITEVLPIVYGFVPPDDPRARATIEAVGDLWNPTGIGGYARYDLASEPDAPGPWSFATAFVAAAEIEMGLQERARRALRWLLDIAGAGGVWFEYYGERQTPPFPPTGIIVWGWAQFLILVDRHLAGVRLEPDRVVITPRLEGLRHVTRIAGNRITIVVDGFDRAQLDGEPIDLIDGSAVVPLPLERDRLLRFDATEE